MKHVYRQLGLVNDGTLLTLERQQQQQQKGGCKSPLFGKTLGKNFVDNYPSLIVTTPKKNVE